MLCMSPDLHQFCEVCVSEGSEITGKLVGWVSGAKPAVGAIEIEIAIGFDTT